MIIILLITNTSNSTVDFLAAVAVEAVVDSPSLEVAAAYTAVAADTAVVVAGTFVVEDTPCLELRHRVGEAFQAACCRLVVASYPAA